MAKSWHGLAVANIARTLYTELTSWQAPAMRRDFDMLPDGDRHGWLSVAMEVVNGLGDLAPSEYDDMSVENFLGAGRTEYRYCTGWMSEEKTDAEG